MKPSEREGGNSQSPLPFDLPLREPDRPDRRGAAAPAVRAPRARQKVVPIFPPDAALPARDETAVADDRPALPTSRAAEDDSAVRPGRRLLGGLVDLALIALWTVLVALGASWLLPSGSSFSTTPVLVAGFLFSMFAVVVPLTLWGRTLGLLVIKSRAVVTEDLRLDDRRHPHHAANSSLGLPPLRALQRWLGGILTVAGLAFPAALLWTGESLADRISASRIRRA